MEDVPLNTGLFCAWVYSSFYVEFEYCHVQKDKHKTCDDYVK